VEAAIAQTESRLRQLTEAQADPAIFRDAARAREVGRDRADAEARLAELYREWETLATDLPG
jgi:hypothetical protein